MYDFCCAVEGAPGCGKIVGIYPGIDRGEIAVVSGKQHVLNEPELVRERFGNQT